MDLVIVLIFISSQLVDTVSTGCKTGSCSNYGAYREVCNSTSPPCQFTCVNGREIEIFSAAFKVFQGSSCQHTCGPIHRSVWNDWCDDKSTCNINSTWMHAFTLPGNQYGATKHLLLIYSCVEESGEYSTPDPASLITGLENFTGSIVGDTMQTSESISNTPTEADIANVQTTTLLRQEATYKSDINQIITTGASSKPTGPTTLGDDSHDTESQKQQVDDKSLEQGSLGHVGFKEGETAGIVIGTLVCVGGLVLLVVLVLLRQRRLSKRLNELENPVYKDPGLMPTPVIAGSYDNEAYGQVTDMKSNDKGPSDMVYDNNVTNNNPITIYDNNVQAKPAHVPYLEVVAHSNTYDEVTIQPEAPTYSVPDKDKVVPNAPPEDDPPEVPADYELAQPPVPPKSFITEDTLDYKVTGEDELVDNEAYRAFDGEGGDGLVYNDAYHALC